MISELSVLIPVYNFDVTNLVTNLLKQCRQQNCRFEICVTDDASEEKFRLNHRELNNQPEVRYVELRRNVGRAAIRNLLASEAKFNWLLFLDNDSALPDVNFIKRYLESPETSPVIIGGTIYDKNAPANEFMLRWNYGRAREEVKAAIRNRQPHERLTLNNIFIRKAVYLAHLLETNLLHDYGHEDTRFGWELKESGIPVMHIDNPVIHLGLENAADFLRKTEKAVGNLHYLYTSQQEIENSKLLKSYALLQKTRMVKTFISMFKKILPSVLQNLRSAEPSLFYFDLYKLYLFAELNLNLKKDTQL